MRCCSARGHVENARSSVSTVTKGSGPCTNSEPQFPGPIQAKLTSNQDGRTCFLALEGYNQNPACLIRHTLFAHARLPLQAVRALVMIERAQTRCAPTRYSARAASDFSVTGGQALALTMTGPRRAPNWQR